MPRTYSREDISRVVSAADAAFPGTQPAAPTTGVSGSEVTPLPAGVFRTAGYGGLMIDVDQGVGAAATTYQLLAWNKKSGKWYAQGAAIAPTAGLQNVRTVITNWASDYAFVSVAGTTVAATIWVIGVDNVTS